MKFNHLDERFIGMGRVKFRRPWAWQPRYETELLLEDHAVPVLPIFPTSFANGNQFTGVLDMSRYNRVQFICACGTVGANGNVIFQMQSTNNANGASNTNLATTNSGTATAVTINTSSQMATLEARADQLGGQRYLQCSASVTDGPAVVCVIPLASEARQHPSGGTVGGQDIVQLPGGNRVYA